MSTLSPSQRIRRWSLFLWLWRLHRWLGLGLGVVILVLSVTGGLLVLHHDLERLLYPDRHVVAAPAGDAVRVPIVPLLQKLQAEAPVGYRPLRLEPGHGHTASDKIVFVGPDRTRWSAFVNPWTGDILWRGHDQSLFTPWLLHLHMHLQAGKWGYLVTGLASVALIFLGLTGVWITRDRLANLLRHPFRVSRGWRVGLSDLHKWTGLVSLYFILILGGTGLWFSILIAPGQLKAEARPPLAPAFDISTLTAIEPAIAATAREFPDAELARVIFPWDAGIKLQVRVLHRSAPIWEKFSRMDFDPVTGAPLRVVRASEATTAQKWQAILGPLHFGYYGSSITKWLYVLGGFSPAILFLSGSAIWWLRRRKTASAQTPRRPTATGVSNSPLPAR
jgi:uncharacterized iron-regulated membrane protein